MKKSIFLPLLVITLLLSNITLKAELPNYIAISNNKTSLEMEITFANYTDGDLDGIEDDVVSIFTIDLESEYRINVFAIEALLTLPSGNTFYYVLIFITTNNHLDFTWFMYNTATEPGWYTLALTAILFIGGRAEGTAYYIFDPAEVGSGDPT
jgi:hypothetical protein